MKEQNYVTVDTGSYIVGKGLTSIKNLVKKVRDGQQPIKNIQGVTVIDGQFDPILKEEPNKSGRIRTVISVDFLHWYFVTNGVDRRDSNLKALDSEFKGQLKGQWIGHPKVTDGNFNGHVDRHPIVNAEFEEIPQQSTQSDVLQVMLDYEQKRVKSLEKEVEDYKKEIIEYKEQIKEILKKQEEREQRLLDITENSQRLVQNQQSLQIQPKQLEEDTTKPRKWWQRKRD